MKKAKVLLTAIAAVTVIGGAFAFVSNKKNGTIYCSTSSGGTSTSTRYVLDSQGQSLFCTTAPNTTVNTFTSKVTPNE